MLAAAKDESVPLLAAVLLAENSRRGFATSTHELHRAFRFANSNTMTGLDVCLYDEGRGSRRTSKERDSESGLDYFGARYFGSALGRFISPDPMLNSGKPWDPQSWNSYAYALNNPLGILDPTGLYNVDCGSDKTCIQAAKDLKNGLKDLQKKVDNMKDGTQKTRLENALKALGTENDKNNVNVSFGATKGGGAGETDPVNDPQTFKESFNVTLDPNKRRRARSLRRIEI